MGDRDSYLYDLLRGRTDEPIPDGVIDLGHDVLILPEYHNDSTEMVGFIETHPSPEGTGCHGYVLLDVPEVADIQRTKWQLVSRDPLHIEPSVLCGPHGCGHHGFIRAGRWEPC